MNKLYYCINIQYNLFMNKIIHINDPILIEYNSSVDKESAKKMIAFKYFSNDICLLDKYLKDKDVIDNSSIAHIAFEPKSQLEFSF